MTHDTSAHVHNPDPPTKFRKWTVEETATLCDMRDDRYTFETIAARLGRTAISVKERWRTINRSEAQLRERADRSFRAYKPKAEEAQRFRRPRTPPITPDHVFIEREARISAPRSLTAIFCGDPAPGWSALDRKRQGVSA